MKNLPLPHCDQSVLHAPGTCEYCDRHKYEQTLREHWRINFTGEHDPSKAPCPSTHFRADEVRDRWPGNTPGGFTAAQNPDGTWSEIEPLPTYGIVGKAEERLRKRGFKRLANLLARWDERGLG